LRQIFLVAKQRILRRAMGSKRSQERMHDIESKLRRGMTQNGISPERSKKSSRKLLRSRNSAFRIARGKFCVNRVCQRFFEGLLSGGF